MVPLVTPRKDLEFCRIFEELLAYIVDSPVYSPRGAETPRDFTTVAGSGDSPVMNIPRSQPKLVGKNTCWCQINTPGVKTLL
jgi:hypothetical protein